MPAAEKEKGVRPDGGPRRCDTHESVIARNAETNKKTSNANRVARVLRPQRLLSRPTLPGRELLLLPPPSQCITRAPLVRIQHHYTHTRRVHGPPLPPPPHYKYKTKHAAAPLCAAATLFSNASLSLIYDPGV